MKSTFKAVMGVSRKSAHQLNPENLSDTSEEEFEEPFDGMVEWWVRIASEELLFDGNSRYEVGIYYAMVLC